MMEFHLDRFPGRKVESDYQALMSMMSADFIMKNQRFKKLELATPEIHPMDIYGSQTAPLTLIGFGSTKLPVLEAMNWLTKENIHVNFLKIHSMSPFPSDLVATVIRNAEKTLVLEENYEGQFEGLIREK